MSRGHRQQRKRARIARERIAVEEGWRLHSVAYDAWAHAEDEAYRKADPERWRAEIEADIEAEMRLLKTWEGRAS